MLRTGLTLTRCLQLTALCLALQAQPACAQQAAADSAAEDSATMKALQARAKALRSEADLQFKAAEAECYRKFLVNRCIDQARKQRLQTIEHARELEAQARRIDLAQRQRAAAEVLAGQAAAASTPAAVDSQGGQSGAELAPPAQSAPAALSSGLPATSADAERIRADRARQVEEAAAAEEAARARRDAESAARRERSAAQAAERAAAAERDRARYEERLRRHEEEQAGKKK